MNDSILQAAKLPARQEAIKAVCLHRSSTFVEFPPQDVESSVAARFKKIVAKFHSEVAVRSGNAVVTYGELDAMSDSIARFLLDRRGFEPEPVPLLFYKGIDQIASALGVLKAGKFFVLLDPLSPASRTAAIMNDLGSNFILSDQSHFAYAKALPTEGCSILIPEPMPPIGTLDTAGVRIAPGAFADIRFTSGSTGKPKGVIQSHRNLLHQVLLYTNLFMISARDRVSLLTANTGNAITTIFLGVLNGATVLPFDVQKEGVKALVNWLQSEKISFAMISSSLFRSLCDSLTGAEDFSALRVIRLASEVAYKSDVDLYKRHFPPSCVLVNGLSSSETNLLATFYIDHDTEIEGDDLPVGYPVEGKEIDLEDDTGRLVGFNQIGEIVVRSKYLAPGYWNNPESTQAKFKPDPNDPEKTLYYSGDLGLRLPDGALVCKGRKDFRVKIRGYGVDLIEIEKALLSHQDINKAVVIAHTIENESARLIGYFTSGQQSVLSVSELRRYLKEKLPEYMIPTALVRLETIPLTSSGKVDRKALPVVITTRPELDTPFVAAQTSEEREVVSIWAEVLGVDQVGIRDDFFDLGGDSLAANRVVARVFRTFRLELPVNALFESPTVAEMAEVIARYGGNTLGDRELNEILKDVESISEDDARQLLNDQSLNSQLSPRPKAR